MANVEVVNNLESAGRVMPEKGTNLEIVPNFQSDDSFPNLVKKGGKRKKSISSPLGNHPNKKKGNNPTSQNEATTLSLRREEDTQQEREVEGSE